MRYSTVLCSLALAVLSAAHAGNVCTWTGGARDNRWSSPLNWNTPPVSGNGDELVFDTTSGAIVTENTVEGFDIAKITVTGGNGLTINGERIMIKSGPDGTADTNAGRIPVWDSGASQVILNAPMAIDKTYCSFDHTDSSGGLVIVNGDLSYLGSGVLCLRSKRYSAVALRFNGAVASPNGLIKVFPFVGGEIPQVEFLGKVSAKDFGLSNYTGDWGGSVTIKNTMSTPSSIETLHSGFGHLYLDSENVFAEGGILNVYHHYYGSSNGTTLSADQKIKRLVCSNRGAVVGMKRSETYIRGLGYPTLTVADDADEDVSFYFDGELNLVWSPVNASTLSITNAMTGFYSNTISGTLTVAAGSVKACAGATFKSLSKLVVLNAARFEVSESNANPFGNDTAAFLDMDARLMLKSDCTFASVVADGQYVAAGTYTAAQLPEAIAEGSTGTLTVLAEPVLACWICPDGEFSTAANWLSGQMPSASLPGFIGCIPGAVTSRISSATSVGGMVTVDGFVGGRPAVLETSADVSFVGNGLALGSHGRLNVTAGTVTTKDLTTEAGSEIVISGTGALTSEKINGDLSAPSVLDATIRLSDESTFTSAVSESRETQSGTTYLRDLFGASSGNTLLMEASGYSRYISRALTFGLGTRPSGATTGGKSCFSFAGHASGSVGRYAYVGYRPNGNGELCISDQAVFSNDAINSRWSYGLFVGGYSSDSAVPANGVVRVSGGRLLVWGNCEDQAPTGLGVGWGVAADSGNTNCNVGTVYLSGGAITNRGTTAWTVIGAGAARGAVYQTGGIFAAVPDANSYSNNTVIGFRGGNGRYEISGGRYYGTANVIVGGMAKEDGPLPNRYTALATDRKGTGVLKVTGGTFETTKDVLVSHGGDGAVEIGAGGTLKAANLRLESNTAKLLFTVGEGDKCGKIVLSGALTVAEGATIEVDVSNLVGNEKIPLVEAGDLSGVDIQRIVLKGDKKHNVAMMEIGNCLCVGRRCGMAIFVR